MSRLAELLSRLTEGHRFLYVINFALQFCSIFFTVFTTFLSKVMVDALSGLETLQGEDFYIEVLVIDIITAGNGAEFLVDNLYILPIALICSALVTALFSAARMLLRSYTSAVIGRDMQYRLFAHLERLPYSYFQTHKSGDLIQTCTRDLDVLRRFLIGDVSLLFYCFDTVLLCGIILLSINVRLTLVSLSFLPVMFLYSFFLIGKVRKRYRETDDAEALLTDKITENLQAVRIVKAFHNEGEEIERFEEKLGVYRQKFIRWRILSSFFFSSSDILVFGCKAIALIYGLYLAVIGDISSGTLYITFTFIEMMVWPLRDLASVLSNMGQYMASADRVRLIYDVEPEDRESGLSPEIRGGFVFDDVEFNYNDGPNNPDVLEGVSFSVEPGQSVALIGKTGSGKSTLMNLLTRLYDYTGGHIYLDGVELKEIRKDYLRSQVVPVLQDPFLFSRSVRDNIAIAHPGLSEEKIRRAAKIAAVDETIMHFEKGYDTPVGERGATLSGGQRQRVAIARSLLSESPVIIFDDSLSAVDTETDLKIRTNLKAMMGKATCFIVTHRVATAKDADLIVVLEEGKVAEIGTHEELKKGGGLYSRIAKVQSLAE